MTKRQKEMLKKRALLEFLNDYPEIQNENIAKYGLLKNIEYIELSYYLLYVECYNGRVFIYAPKERFRTKEEEENVDKA